MEFWLHLYVEYYNNVQIEHNRKMCKKNCIVTVE